MKTYRFAVAAAAVFLSVAAPSARADLYTTSIGSLIPGYGPNDDSTFAAINLGFSVNFFGTTYTSIYANNNGNATFGNATSNYTPSPLNSQTVFPMIAPYWTDLDSRGSAPAGTGVYVTQSANRTVFTWETMGYYSQNYTGLATFQLVLNNPNAPLAAGEGTIGFFYGSMTAGNDGHSVQAGFGDGLTAVNTGEIAYAGGSTAAVSAQLSGTHVWFNVDATGAPVVSAVPEPETYALMLGGLALLGLGGRLRRRRV